MVNLIALLPYAEKLTKKHGKVWGLVIYLVLILIAIWLVKKGWDNVKEVFQTEKDRRQLDEALNVLIDNPADGSSPEIWEQEQFAPQAQLIADNIYNHMVGAGTQEYSIVEALSPLNGWQLSMVASAFGYRDYESTWSVNRPLNIFGWFDEELCSNVVFCPVMVSDDVEGCSSVTDFCSERGIVRQIFKRMSNEIN